MSALEERLRAARPVPAETPALDAAVRASARAILVAETTRRRPGRRRRWAALGVAFALVGGGTAVAALLTDGEIPGRAPGRDSAGGSLAVDGEVAAWVEKRPGGMAVLAARRVDGAWVAPRLLGRGGGDVRVATVDGGGAVVVWASRHGVWSAELRADGTVAPAARLAGFAGPAIKLDLSEAGDGTLVAGWEAEGGPKRSFVAVRRTGRWGAARPLPTPPGAEGFQPSVAVGADGMIAVAWQVLSLHGSEVRAGLRAPGGPWRQKVLARARSAGDQNVAIAADGRVLVTWSQLASEDAASQVMLATGDTSSGWSPPRVVGYAGSTPRVAALGSGAIVAWVVSDEDDPESGRVMAATLAGDGRAGPPTAVSEAAGGGDHLWPGAGRHRSRRVEDRGHGLGGPEGLPAQVHAERHLHRGPELPRGERRRHRHAGEHRPGEHVVAPGRADALLVRLRGVLPAGVLTRAAGAPPRPVRSWPTPSAAPRPPAARARPVGG